MIKVKPGDRVQTNFGTAIVIEVGSRDALVWYEDIVKDSIPEKMRLQAYLVDASDYDNQLQMVIGRGFIRGDVLSLPNLRAEGGEYIMSILGDPRFKKSSKTTLVASEKNLGEWLADAKRYSLGMEGETGGPSGLKFL